MTATATRPAYGPNPSEGASAPPAPRRARKPPRAGLPLSTQRTLIALLASALGIVPLKSLFSDLGWLLDVWLTMIIVIAPAALLRLRRPPGALDIWPGLILLVPWLTIRFVPDHAFLGFLPGRASWHDVSLLLTDLHRTTRNEVAPIHTTVAVRLVVCALIGLLAALVDLIAVVGRRGALAGVPLLVVYTVAGAVPRHPVSWVLFAVAAVGYLLLLALDAGEDLQSWGRRINARGTRHRTALSVSTPRIAVAAIVVAVVLPLLVPGQSRNLIANAFHNGSGNGIGGFGGGSSGSISPFAALKGELTRPKPVTLARVHLRSGGGNEPFYLRVNVLEKFTGDGWVVGDHGSTENVEDTLYPTIPGGGGGNESTQQATITLTAPSSNAPVFAIPTSITGLEAGTTWSPKDQILLGAKPDAGDEYIEQFRQPQPTTAQLNAATQRPGPALAPLLDLPSDFPSYAHDVVTGLIKGKSTPYEQARAISNYFADPANGFVYDLKTTASDSGNALVDFLKNKHGFCQQYAAAMGVMLRDAGIPSRVVLGYMHPSADRRGDFTVSTSEAHSWVEAYFSGIGWVPFDPTPIAGLAGGAKSDLPWAPHAYASNGADPNAGNNGPKATGSSKSGGAPTSAASSVAPPLTKVTRASKQADEMSWRWWTLGAVLLALLLVVPLLPAAARGRRRRHRLTAARRDGDPDALWAELSDTAVDLGYVWSPARSPRQVATWLSRDAGGSTSSLQALASAVEYGRYSPADRTTDARNGVSALADDLREVTGELRSRRSRGTRLRATLWPASLGWGTWLAELVRRRS